MLQHFQTRIEKLTFVGLLAAFALATVAALLSVASQIGKPFPGFVVWSNLVVPAIGTSDWPGQQAAVPLRSVMRAGNGRELTRADELRQLVRALPVGTPVTYTFQRGAETTTVTVPTSILRWRHVLPAYAGYIVDGLAFFATALIVFYFKPQLPAARAALMVGTFLGVTLILALDLFSQFWLERAYFCFESLMPGALLHFALSFPEQKGWVHRHPRLAWLVYLPFLPLAILQNWFLDRDAVWHLRVNDWVYTATAAAGLAVFVSLVHSFTAARTPHARQQAKTVLGGVTLAAFIPSLGLLSITLLGLQIPMNLLSPFFFTYPVSIAYAIARHDLFAVDRYLRTGVVYAALSVVMVLSYAGMVLVTERWMGGQPQLPPWLIPLYLFAVIAAFDPLRSRIQSAVDQLFYRQAYNYRRTVEATSRTLASVLDSERIARTLLSTLTEGMAIAWAVVHVLDESGAAPQTFGQPEQQAARCRAVLSADGGWLARLSTRLGPLASDDVQSARANGLDLRPLLAIGTSIVLPLRSHDRLLGVVVLGEKSSGAYYTDDDLDLLDTLVNQTSLALTNAQAYEIIRNTQADLVRAERMAAVGEMAAAVAHGIRNPLSGIRATAQVAREDADEQPRLVRDLDRILSEADRLERRVRTIIDLARPVDVQLSARDIGAFLLELAAGMRTRLPATVRLITEIDGNVRLAAFDAARLNEVVETIIINAVEAMDSNGTIQLSAGISPANDSRVVVSIADSGPGIPPAALSKVFDLFYTTKSSGTGVGLAMAKRLVGRQGGTIDVKNRDGGGAVFSIDLPSAAPTMARND
ncbi:MAG: GAF domain-containing protein [Deltaproteobacteria bacterium]|nr:GAF domain-containing protein [Deltaproteobacteria bacterium]